MTYKKDQKVVVKDSDNKLIEGTILERADFGEEVLWWVEFQDKGHKEITIFTEDKLNEWNVVSLHTYCVCGSATLKHPGHSYYCPLK